ncbi:MAG: TauD/TfdA family dioxygenase [Gammaproteobacteria bacterium]|nr:TauD/TfdA family dioxygenase [Gammaproteobacteria bacterium]
MIRIERLPAPFGCAAYGVDLTAGVDDDQFRTLSQALYQHRLLVLKNQTCNKDAFLRFGRQWGVPIQHVVDTARMPGYPDLLEVGNMARRKQDPLTRNSAAFWHTDQSYEADVATATMLYAQKVPDEGGETRILDMKAAYDDLDEPTRERIDGLVAVHLYGSTSGRDGELPTPKLTDAQAANVPPVPHPLVRPHAVTGERALYAIGGTAFDIEGMSSDDADRLIRTLKAHCVQDKYIYAHKYEVGDIAIWDTQMTMHCATPIDAPNGPGTERLLWRISVRGVPGVYARAAVAA